MPSDARIPSTVHSGCGISYNGLNCKLGLLPSAIQTRTDMLFNHFIYILWVSTRNKESKPKQQVQ